MLVLQCSCSENPGGDERQSMVIELEELGGLDQLGTVLLLPLFHLYKHFFYNLESAVQCFPI